ncbi:hypothetical protein BV898_16952 [Hypsibius exemplaris]|uniref:Uncharacterized protein n=1 Tax=Hypsibius exemplaris TaxID=2072580 RepID=A0A9X6NE73_HYPEX|nr:hypothetical protein BV898_16952 [Hypsibius exemplaris]
MANYESNIRDVPQDDAGDDQADYFPFAMLEHPSIRKRTWMNVYRQQEMEKDKAAEEFERGQEKALLAQEVALAAQPMGPEVRAVMNHLINRIKKQDAKIKSQDERIDKLERQMGMMLQNMQKQENEIAALKAENVELRRVCAAQQVSIDTLAIQMNFTPGEDQIRELLNLRGGTTPENRATYDGLRGQENMMLRQQLILIDQRFASHTKSINELKARIDHVEQQQNMSEAAKSQQMMAVFGV